MKFLFSASAPCRGRVSRRTRAAGYYGPAMTLSLLLAGCSPALHEPADSATPRQVFAIGMENLVDRYIEPLDAGTLTVAGLTRLAALDGSLAIRRTADAVQLDVGSEVRAQHTAPAPDDVYGWAWLAADMVADARRHSATIGRLGQEDIFEAVFGGALGGFDQYSRYTSAEAAQRNRASRDGFGGVGISVSQDDGFTVVTQVHRETPAARAGLKVDDRITHVDGHPIAGLALDKVVTRLRGKIDSLVVVRVERMGAVQPIDLGIRRTHILLPTVTARRNDGLLEIKLSGFNQGTVRTLRRELERAEREMGPQLRGIILDMRSNPGGLLDQAVAVADLFLARGRIVSTKGRHTESNQVFDATPAEYARGVPLAVLINGRSASAAEIVAVALRDTRRAVIIGSSSFGKGSVQTIARLPNGGEITLTWARLLAPSGQTLDRQGIVPALCTGAGAARTEALLKALAGLDRAGGVLPATLIRSQSGVPHHAGAALNACPPSVSENAADIEVARIVLGNGPLYAQAVSDSPSVAKR